MNDFTYRLVISKELSFYHVYPTYDSDMLSMAPRPNIDLLATFPITGA